MRDFGVLVFRRRPAVNEMFTMMPARFICVIPGLGDPGGAAARDSLDVLIVYQGCAYRWPVLADSARFSVPRGGQAGPAGGSWSPWRQPGDDAGGHPLAQLLPILPELGTALLISHEGVYGQGSGGPEREHVPPLVGDGQMKLQGRPDMVLVTESQYQELDAVVTRLLRFPGGGRRRRGGLARAGRAHAS